MRAAPCAVPSVLVDFMVPPTGGLLSISVRTRPRHRGRPWRGGTCPPDRAGWALSVEDPLVAERNPLPIKTRAGSAERTGRMPGDSMIPDPMASFTRAVTVAVPPKRVWPWLLQMGAGRAGWYSYDRVDNGGEPSAWRVLPEHQSVAVGDILPALPGAEDAFVVDTLDPERELLLTVPFPDGEVMVTWDFVLNPLGSDQTRLVGEGWRLGGRDVHRGHAGSNWRTGFSLSFPSHSCSLWQALATGSWRRRCYGGSSSGRRAREMGLIHLLGSLDNWNLGMSW